MCLCLLSSSVSPQKLEMSLMLVFGHPQTVDTGVLSGCEMVAVRHMVLSVTSCMSENVT